MEYILYKQQGTFSNEGQNNELDIRVFRITPFHFFAEIEKFQMKTFILRLYFGIITAFNTKLFYVVDNNRLIHYSYLIPCCLKFKFLTKNDYEIGPCFTLKDYRGKGIYPAVLNKIVTSISTNPFFYMMVSPQNISSIKGIEKAQFVRCGIVKKTLAKNYKVISV